MFGTSEWLFLGILTACLGFFAYILKKLMGLVVELVEQVRMTEAARSDPQVARMQAQVRARAMEEQPKATNLQDYVRKQMDKQRQNETKRGKAAEPPKEDRRSVMKTLQPADMEP